MAEGVTAYSVSKNYEKDGEKLKRKNQDCPKCGEGYRLAEHDNRKTCGRCRYTEFK